MEGLFHAHRLHHRWQTGLEVMNWVTCKITYDELIRLTEKNYGPYGTHRSRESDAPRGVMSECAKHLYTFIKLISVTFRWTILEQNWNTNEKWVIFPMRCISKLLTLQLTLLGYSFCSIKRIVKTWTSYFSEIMHFRTKEAMAIRFFCSNKD